MLRGKVWVNSSDGKQKTAPCDQVEKTARSQDLFPRPWSNERGGAGSWEGAHGDIERLWGEGKGPVPSTQLSDELSQEG